MPPAGVSSRGARVAPPVPGTACPWHCSPRGLPVPLLWGAGSVQEQQDPSQSHQDPSQSQQGHSTQAGGLCEWGGITPRRVAEHFQEPGFCLSHVWGGS